MPEVHPNPNKQNQNNRPPPRKQKLRTENREPGTALPITPQNILADKQPKALIRQRVPHPPSRFCEEGEG